MTGIDLMWSGLGAMFELIGIAVIAYFPSILILIACWNEDRKQDE